MYLSYEAARTDNIDECIDKCFVNDDCDMITYYPTVQTLSNCRLFKVKFGDGFTGTYCDALSNGAFTEADDAITVKVKSTFMSLFD